VYYTLKGNIDMMNQRFDSAEVNMKKGLDLGMPMKEAEGASAAADGHAVAAEERPQNRPSAISAKLSARASRIRKARRPPTCR
jgi:hypothetical protein